MEKKSVCFAEVILTNLTAGEPEVAWDEVAVGLPERVFGRDQLRSRGAKTLHAVHWAVSKG